MVRIDKNIIFDYDKNTFHVDEFSNFGRTTKKIKIVSQILNVLTAVLAYLIVALWGTGSLTACFSLSLSLLFKIIIVNVALLFILVFILRGLNVLNIWHMGDIFSSLKIFSRDKNEDNFIYVFEKRSNLKLSGNFLSKSDEKMDYNNVLTCVQNKKKLILHYSLYLNLRMLVIIFIVFFLYSVSPYNQVQGNVMTVVISLCMYPFIFRIFAYSPIKSYQFWKSLESSLERFISSKKITPNKSMINYEEIHKKVEEEMKDEQ
ncbi:hypothetical protein [Lactococcus allomyrinae]|uniref:Uncharacterized protein n=1 Tax=Lactococcus allomyrinae TaxID=2419773 RepID=A0A387BEG9_9LACT|nr:hypothetical protein [Lactococcus allomyrinae]AYG00462.1 hypothetical protein D7I46_04780 [Lactococcus allomyrinae]